MRPPKSPEVVLVHNFNASQRETGDKVAFWNLEVPSEAGLNMMHTTVFKTTRLGRECHPSSAKEYQAAQLSVTIHAAHGRARGPTRDINNGGAFLELCFTCRAA